MSIRYLEVTLRLKFSDDLTEEDRREIADDVRSVLHHEADSKGFGTDHNIQDCTTVAEWTAKGAGQ